MNPFPSPLHLPPPLPTSNRDDDVLDIAARRAKSRLRFMFGALLGALLSLGVMPTLAATTPPSACAYAFAAGTTITNLSSCAQSGNLVVGSGAGTCGPNLCVDQSFVGAKGWGSITINAGATLAFPLGSKTALDTAGIVLNGSLIAGAKGNPVTGSKQLTINFTDQRAVTGVTKGISVNSGGSLQLFGQHGVAKPTGLDPQAPSWTYLKAPAGPASLYGQGLGIGAPVASNGATTLVVADTVDWAAGDWVVVAGTDFSPDSAEFVQIQSSSCAAGSCTLTLAAGTPLLNYHFGSLAPTSGKGGFSNGVTQNFGVDERAEVGLISRSIKLTASISGGVASNGGEIIVMQGFNKVQIQGVEIEKFGKAQLGSYPLHFHQVGNAKNVLVDSNSVHHSFNKCMTLHSTNGVTLSNNVCARAVGHLFYMESGTEQNNNLLFNLGIGAMDNAFSIPTGNSAALASFWRGDYLVNSNPNYGYNGFNVAFSDQATVNGAANTPSGFWVTNPANNLMGNSVAGCQDLGRAYWILPDPASATLPGGKISRNRAHGCYNGFDTAADDGVTGAQLWTPQGKCPAQSTLSNCDLIARIDFPTASRNRNRGIWVRASWYAITNARLATNRDSVSLVSSGGSEGSPPGEWSLLQDAILLGISANNPWRFGPCPYPGQNGFGGVAGCYSPVAGNGFPSPVWNMNGVMFYDGPARIENAKFVNFNQNINPYLSSADLSYLNYYIASKNTIPGQSAIFVYEGDAAMGWFQSNVNSYPPTQYTQGLTFQNVNLRHQVYTANVELTAAPPPATGGNFRDGDKFTVILDRDQSLTGLQVVSAGSKPTPIAGAYPISLNNLPFLAGPATVDECLAIGQQDQLLEGRPTSLISPYSYATLEFSALTSPCNGVVQPGQPNCQNNNFMTFTKDQIDYGGNYQFTDNAFIVPASGQAITQTVNCGGSTVPGAAGVKGHACVTLTGRNGNGIYEPKLVNGLGYTVGASNGVPPFVSLMYTDAHVPGGISGTTPFQTRIGLCYKNQGQVAPASATAFTVKKGSKSFAGPNGNPATLAPNYFNQLQCNGLDNVMCGTAGPAYCFTTWCPGSPFYPSGTAATNLPSVSTIGDLNNPTLCPNGQCFFYDAGSGLLFVNLVQEQPNAGTAYSSPLGSCNSTKAPFCADSSFYSCPGPGCELLTISVAGGYTAGAPSDCTPYGGSTDYTQSYPANLPQLAYGNGTVVQSSTQGGVNSLYPHNAPTNAPSGFCPVNAPATPAWPAATGISGIFTMGLPANVNASIKQGSNSVSPIAGTSLIPLVAGQSYTLSATQSGCASQCSCTQNFTVNQSGNGYTSSGNNCCQMGSSGGNTLGIAAAPYVCVGP
jgi:hypothetical protein